MVIDDDELLKEQLTLEEEMVTLGSNRYLERTSKLRASGSLSQTQGGNEMASGGTERVAHRISEWCTDHFLRVKKAGGRPQAVYHTLYNLDPFVVAYLGLRVTLDQMTTTPTFQRVAMKIGNAVEEEMKFRAFESNQPGLYKWCLKKTKNASSERHKRTVFNIAASRNLEWNPWPEEIKLRLGVITVECIRKACGIIEIGTLPNNHKNTELYLMPNHATLAWLRAHDAEAHLLCPVRMPCIIPPKPWTNPWDGGYHSERMVRVPLVKTSNQQYLEELNLANPASVYNAVNALQNTAWEVNRDVLSAVESVWAGQRAVAGLPPNQDPPLPSKPHDIDTNEQARREYRRKAAETWEAIIPIRSQRIQTAQILSLAKRFKGRAIYFPYQLDFRGRVYPQPGGLQPQGCDLAKGLLRFSEGLPLSCDEAVNWFYIHGANCFGIDKVSFADRLAWVEAHRERIRATAQAPTDNLWWAEADNPIQFLAWCLEYGHHDEPGFVSHLAVALDASCSGLQHFSAMLRDPVGAKSVNLTPSEAPLDVYKDVASVSTKMLHACVNDPELLIPVKSGKQWCTWTRGEVARMWLAYGVERKVTKRPVMTQPYGSTKRACKSFILEAVEKRGGHPFGDNLLEACGYLADIVWEAIGEVVVAARMAMGWLQKAARIAASKGLAVSWTAPSGFPVLQAYPAMGQRRIRLAMGDHITMRLTLQHDTPELDRRRQANGISPNFVHSCDAAALVAAVCESKVQGIDAFACVHDSFGTHAANTQKFVECIKATFVKQYEDHDVLKELKLELEGLGVEIEDTPPKGTLEIRDVLKSSYCFA